MDQRHVETNRRSRRSPVYLKASIEVDGIPVPVTLRNLSAEGALVEGECLPPEGAITRFQRDKLRVKARVAWVHDRLAGIAFDRDLKREDVLRHVPTPSPQPLPACVKRPGFASRPLAEHERRMLEAWVTPALVARPGD